MRFMFRLMCVHDALLNNQEVPKCVDVIIRYFKSSYTGIQSQQGQTLFSFSGNHYRLILFPISLVKIVL